MVAPNRAREQDEVRELSLAEIRREREALGVGIYQHGGFAGWYRLWGLTPPARRTIKEEALLLDTAGFNRLLERVREKLATYHALPWWRRLFSRNPCRSRDYRLMMYEGSRVYLSLSIGIDSKPLSDNYTGSFLNALRASRRGRLWCERFAEDDRLRLEKEREREQWRVVAQGSRQEVESLGNSNCLPLGRTCEARGGDVGVLISPSLSQNRQAEIEQTEIELQNAMQLVSGIKEKVASPLEKYNQTDLSKELRTVNERVSLTCRLTRGLLTRLGKGSKTEPLEVKLSLLLLDYQVLSWQMKERTGRSKEETRRSKEKTRRMKAITQSMARRTDEVRRSRDRAQARAVHYLEQRSLLLDGWEREILRRRNLVKPPHQDPIAWTEVDIFWGRIAILQDAQRGGVFHLLRRSAVFTAPTSVFRRIVGADSRGLGDKQSWVDMEIRIVEESPAASQVGIFGGAGAGANAANNEAAAPGEAAGNVAAPNGGAGNIAPGDEEAANDAEAKRADEQQQPGKR